jgi:hypothetical protein
MESNDSEGVMQAFASSGTDKRTGQDRRRRSDPRYRGPERRRGADRRAANGGRTIQRQPLAGKPSAVAARAPGVHRLAPTNGHTILSPLVIVMRIASEFAYVEADEAMGYDRVEDIIRQIESRSRRNKDALLAERIEQLEKVKDRAVHVCFGDDPGSDTGYLCAVVIPGEPLIFEYESPVHEEAVQPLLGRCAKILGYGIGNGVANDFVANLLPRIDPRRPKGRF